MGFCLGVWASGFGSTFCLVLKRMGKWGIFKIKWVLVMNWSSHGLGFNKYIDIVPCSREYVFFRALALENVNTKSKGSLEF